MSVVFLLFGVAAVTSQQLDVRSLRGVGNLTSPVNLGTAGNYVILTKAGISTVPATAITGNIAVSPAALTYITGFSLTADSTNTFSTSTQVTGKVYGATHSSPTPSELTTAIGDATIAYNDAKSRNCNETLTDLSGTQDR